MKIPLIAAALIAAAPGVPAACTGEGACTRTADHPAVAVQRLQAAQGYDYASKFYPHPAWLYLAAEAPHPMMDHPAVIVARRERERLSQQQELARTQAPARLDRELLSDLLRWAERLSGVPAKAELPALQAMPAQALAAQACPERPGDCRTLVALYDTDRRRILYRDSLDMNDPIDQSFIVHELVHHLQHQRDGDALFSTCPNALAAETDAYAAQNRYLAQFKAWRRVGEMLRFTHCDSAEANLEVRPGGLVLTSRTPQSP